MQALGDFIYQELPRLLTASGAVTSLTYQQVINTSFLSSQTAAPLRVDPLILDLDNDGLETIGINTSNPILFDHNGNGVRTATGWVKSDDAFLVLDRNGNGSIDNGRELFGDSTPLSAGGVAADGFAALAQEDTNGDGKVDSLDARFASLRLWRDLNQDGFSQAGELFTLSSQGIIALNLAKTANSQILANGNQIADLGGYVRSDGSTGTLGEVTAQLGDINLAHNPFYSQFTDPIPLSEQARSLPDMQGAGLVRSLREAASLPTAAGSALATQLAAYAAETTRSGQLVRLDDLLKAWANTSSMATTATGAFAGVHLTVNFAGVTTGSPAWQAWLDKLSVLERFNGQTFLPVPAAGTTLTIDVFNTRETLLDASYAALKASVYGGLLLQTRLKPYLDDITLTVDENGLKVDFSTMESRLDAAYQADSPNAFVDRLELIKYAGQSLEPMGWRGEQKLATWISNAEASGTWATIRAAMGAEFTTTPAAGDDIYLGTNGNDAVNGSGGNDYLLGAGGNDALNGGEGNDRLFGGTGNDTLYGNGGNDLLDGGSGNDYLDGGSGNDSYLFRRGSGYDTIYNSDSSAGRVDTLQLEGLNIGDVRLDKWSDDFVVVIKDSGEWIKVSSFFYSDSYKLDAVQFADGTRWDRATLLAQEMNLVGGSGNDSLSGRNGGPNALYGNDGQDALNGGNGNDRLFGGTGNDTLYGNGGNDLLDGGSGNDYLDGGSGNDSYLFRRGSGYDTIYNSDSSAGRVDTLQLEGLNIGDVRLDKWSDDFVVVIKDSGEWIKVSSFFYSDSYKLDAVQFADGTRWDRATLLAQEMNLVGGSGNDSLSGRNGGPNALYGNDGQDALNGGNGNDRLFGGTGNDTLYGNGGNDLLDGGSGNDYLDGGSGNDTASYTDAPSGVTVSLATGAAQVTGGAGTDTLASIENLTGSSHNDNLTGNSAANLLDGGAGADTLIGGDGSDTYYVDNVGDLVIETNAVLATGGDDTVCSSLAAYTLTANVETLRLVATGAADGTGNSLNNTLYAGAGNNVLDGGAGIDTVSYSLAAAAVTVSLAISAAQATGGSGSDTLVNIENLVGSAYADRLTGDGLANRLNGGAGNDTLNGGVGADTLIGGDGSDIYYVDNVGDSVVELADEGNDIIYSSISWTLGEHIERLYLTGSATTTATGNALANTLYGHANSAANVLTGCLGNDIYYLGAGDSAVEDEGGGIDSVYTYADYTLAANVEHLYLNVATAATLTGNTLANSLRGNAGDDTLVGLTGNDTLNGGLGADTLIGGLGNDSYYVDNAGDSVVEELNEGNDIIYSSISWTLGEHVERLYLTGSDPTTATGNALANTLYGHANTAANVLAGGLGNDVYYLGAGDSAVEDEGGGIDSVYTYADYTLAANVEHLYLNVATAATLTGNALANSLRGNAGDDTLIGLSGNDTLNGGLGNDTLTGGDGKDIIRFDSLLNALTNVDTITDYNVADDTIHLENDIFTALTTTGWLAAESFRRGAVAVDADDYVIYDDVTGALYYDADGNGVAAAVQFAALSGAPTLTHADFLVT
jgi:Ca2+-binding RTX toxin-like protein